MKGNYSAKYVARFYKLPVFLNYDKVMVKLWVEASSIPTVSQTDEVFLLLFFFDVFYNAQYLWHILYVVWFVKKHVVFQTLYCWKECSEKNPRDFHI